jgi:hypothetical protein
MEIFLKVENSVKNYVMPANGNEDYTRKS